MAGAIEELNFLKFSLILLSLNNCMWLVTAILNGQCGSVPYPSALVYILDVANCIFTQIPPIKTFTIDLIIFL